MMNDSNSDPMFNSNKDLTSIFNAENIQNEAMHLQPIINVGTIGHVAGGKSSLVLCLTSKSTQQFAKEKERNITIRLGYANAKIWRCSVCPSPQKYSASASSIMHKNCSCGLQLELINHISIVDCPGHNELTSTMLNGSSVMDYAILVEACSNEMIPAPQTAEHYIATQASNIPTCMIIMNKVDLVKKDKAKEKIEKITNYVKSVTTNTSIASPPVIPISATFGANIDVVCQRLSELKVPLIRNPDEQFKMIVIRSFDINKPGIDVTKLHGGVIGGTIMRGMLKKGDKINIYPGMVREIPEEEKHKQGPEFKYAPILGEVLSIKSDMNELEYAIPGGLLGIQLTIDPSFAKSDLLSGSLVLKTNDVVDGKNIRVYDKIIISITNFITDHDKVMKIIRAKTKPRLMININSNNIDCNVHRYDRETKYLYLKLDWPLAIDTADNFITIINSNTNKDILARGVIINGIECEKM
jgi:translation initiation factor 2 subunit 3